MRVAHHGEGRSWPRGDLQKTYLSYKTKLTWQAAAAVSEQVEEETEKHHDNVLARLPVRGNDHV